MALLVIIMKDPFREFVLFVPIILSFIGLEILIPKKVRFPLGHSIKLSLNCQVLLSSGYFWLFVSNRRQEKELLPWQK